MYRIFGFWVYTFYNDSNQSVSGTHNNSLRGLYAPVYVPVRYIQHEYVDDHGRTDVGLPLDARYEYLPDDSL